jgi:hypothetical protein
MWNSCNRQERTHSQSAGLPGRLFQPRVGDGGRHDCRRVPQNRKLVSEQKCSLGNDLKIGLPYHFKRGQRELALCSPAEWRHPNGLCQVAFALTARPEKQQGRHIGR